MTQIRWSILFFCLLFPTATDLLFREVAVLWLCGCIGAVFLGNCFSGWNIADFILGALPGILLWILSRLSNGIGGGDVLCVFLIGALGGVETGLMILFGGSMLCFLGQMIRIMAWVATKLRRQRAELEIEKAKKMLQMKRELPFVPWLLASIYVNWICQVLDV